MPIAGIVKRRKELFIVFLLLIFLAQSLYTAYSTNLTFDETYSMAVGYYFLKEKDTSMSVLHPPLSLLIGGFPLLFFDIKVPYSYDECTRVSYIKCMHDFLFKSQNYSESMAFFSRLQFIVLSLLLGLAVFSFAEEIYGTKAAFLSLALYAFSPTILGFSNVIFTDMLVAFFVFIFIYSLWKLLALGYTISRLIAAGIFLGLALASKFTALLLIPIIMVCMSVKIIQSSNKFKEFKRLSALFALILLISLIVLYSAYFFSFGTLAGSVPERNLQYAQLTINKGFDSSFSKKLAEYLIYEVKIPMPQYWSGLIGQAMVDVSKNKISYLNGEVYYGGKWHYFFEVLLIKTPIPLLIFFTISFILSAKSVKKWAKNNYQRNSDITNLLYLILPITIFFIMFIFTNFNIGIRHILPIFPFIFVFSSQIANIKLKNPHCYKLFKIFTVLLLVWYILSAVLVSPHYMAYFNEFVGGPKNGHKYLLGSNLDQGQDLKGLAEYVKKKAVGKIKLSYHGTFDPSYYGIHFDALPMEYYLPWVEGFSPDEPRQSYSEDCTKQYGIIAVSVSNLHNTHLLNKTCFDWLKDYEPVERIGYTIFVYNVTG